jgi:hypothetical protein
MNKFYQGKTDKQIAFSEKATQLSIWIFLLIVIYLYFI